ncbi:hypothetical protein OCU04_006609 [Sclerotinia nivalis]|uniref:Uncharacterized protein n=1 Tax=Sclerotinia nivalis TaxID=352851 RepID=A0A9X0DKP3_9HELO|nr:hypothetical protein OCU04_006609 [Sclerotinia nivalis]
MVSSSFSDMMESPYHPDHIFGDEDTWYDAPAGLPEQEIEEYFDALEEQDVLFGLSRNKYVINPKQNYYPVLPTVTLHNEIVVFVTAENFRSDAAEYIHLKRLSDQLVDLQEDHERGINMEDRMIDTLVKKLSAVKETLYELDNVYTGSDCKRKRDLIVDKINACSKTKERLEREYIDTMSMLAKEAEAIRAKWTKERNDRGAQLALQQQRAQKLDTQSRLDGALKREAQLEGRMDGLKADNYWLEIRMEKFEAGYKNLRRLQNGTLGEYNERLDRVIEQRDRQRYRAQKFKSHLKVHRDAIILERRHRDQIRNTSDAYLRELHEEKSRVRELEVEVNQQASRMQQQARWINELETRGMRGEVFNRERGIWETSRATHKRRLKECDEVDRCTEEREVKRRRLH